MLKKTLCVMLVLCTASFADVVATQTDWSGEAGVPGPVTDWGSDYDTSSLVSTTITGVIRLAYGILSTPIEHTVDGDFDGAGSVYAMDVDGDGYTDVLGAAAGADDIAWWENTDGGGTAWTKHTVDGSFYGACSVYATDVDGDGDTDVLGAAYWADAITWWENTDGTGTVWTEYTVDGYFDGASSVYATDVDGDGDTDVLGAGDPYTRNITWWENIYGTGTVWMEHTVDGDFYGAASVYATDVDGDGDTDVLGAAYTDDDITWWENVDGTGTAWTEHTVDGDFYSARSVYATDVDGDGDTDVLGAALSADDITWWENTDGTGTAWTEHTVDGDFGSAASVYATDVDGDGDTDVLGAAFFADDITWWENTDGTGTAWTEHTVDGDFDGAASVYATDIDGDGATDVLGAASGADDITWWEVIGYMGEGNLESSILDAGLVGTWDFFSSNSTEPIGTSVAFQFRSSLDAGDMGAWSDTIFSVNTLLSGILADSTPYLQYRVILETDDHVITPQLEDVLFSYTVYVNTGESSSGEITSWELLAPENPSYGYLSALITVPEPGFVELRVYDVTGRVIAGASQEFSTGTHSVYFHGLAEGVYFCVMSAGDYTATEQVVVLR